MFARHHIILLSLFVGILTATSQAQPCADFNPQRWETVAINLEGDSAGLAAKCELYVQVKRVEQEITSLDGFTEDELAKLKKQAAHCGACRAVVKIKLLQTSWKGKDVRVNGKQKRKASKVYYYSLEGKGFGE